MKLTQQWLAAEKRSREIEISGARPWGVDRLKGELAPLWGTRQLHKGDLPQISFANDAADSRKVLFSGVSEFGTRVAC